jgi:membrane protease subunit HflC
MKILLPLLLMGLIGYLSVFTVSERELAILLKLGEIHRSDFEPGLHFKVPVPVYNQVRKFERRLLNLDFDPERFLTSEKKDVIVDSFLRWRIADVEMFFKAATGDEARAGTLLKQKVNAALREEFAIRTVQEVVSGERGALMSLVTRVANEEAEGLGIEVLDVRVKRIDLPDEVSDSVYRRMRAERERVARDFRSRGAEAAERIRATADRERTVIKAEAYRDAETTRGEGDAVAADTYAKAFSTNKEFYALTRSLNAYRTSFQNKGDVMLLKPDSDFFKYFSNFKGEPTP